MSPPVPRPIPRFIAGSSQEALPYGRWAQRLRDEFAAACAKHEDEASAGPDQVTWFPERAWGGRVYVPATAGGAGGKAIEFFGYVSYERPKDGEPKDFRAVADFTDVTADDNPDWKIDLNEEVIGSWRGESDRAGDVTLVWGTPLVPGAEAVTAELDGEVTDQAPVAEDRFSLIALDAVKGFGDDMFLEVRLWNGRGQELARESLYEAAEEESGADSGGA